jgi:hypothetical protein
MGRCSSILGRLDYNEPAPIGDEQRQRIEECSVTPTPNKKTWYDVHRNAQLVGHVRTGFAGQEFRAVGMNQWVHAASYWNSTDPTHGHAIMRLIKSEQV